MLDLAVLAQIVPALPAIPEPIVEADLSAATWPAAAYFIVDRICSMLETIDEGML